MGVDIGTYRCRIGTFRHGPGIDVVLLKLCVNYGSGIKMIGAVVFIGLLLIMAGVEMNPGPIDTPADKSDIATILKMIGLEKHIDIFLQNEIGVNEVMDMTPDDFQSIGISAIGVRLKITKVCRQYIQDNPTEVKPFWTDKSNQSDTNTVPDQRQTSTHLQSPHALRKISNQHQATAQFDDTEKLIEATGGDDDNMKMEKISNQHQATAQFDDTEKLNEATGVDDDNMKMEKISNQHQATAQFDDTEKLNEATGVDDDNMKMEKISNQHQATAQFDDTEKLNEATGGDDDNMKMEKISNQHQATAQFDDTEKLNEATCGDDDNMKMENPDRQAMPKISYTEYVRLLLLLHRAGLFILRAILLSFVKSLNCKNVDDFLRPFKESLKRLPALQNRLTELFPENGNTDIEKWDITLLAAVLINCCNPLEKKTNVSRLKTIFTNLHGNIKSVIKDNEENIRKRISDYQCEIIFPSTFAPPNDTLDDWGINLLLSVTVATSQSGKDESIRQFMKDVITKEVVDGVSGNSSLCLATFLDKYKSKLIEQRRKQEYISDDLFKQIYPENGIPDVNTWDTEVLLFVLLGIMHSLPQSTIKRIQKIRDLRNITAHPSSISMKPAEFNLRWAEVYSTFKELVKVEMPSEIKTLETIARQCGQQDINLDQENVGKVLQESRDEQFKAVKDVQNEIQRKKADGYSLTDSDTKVVKLEIRVLAPNEQIGQYAESRIKELIKDDDESVSFIIQKLEVVDIQTGCVILFVRYSSLDQLSHLIGLVCGEDLKHHLDDVANKVNSEQKATILATAHIPWLELQRIRRDISLIVQEKHVQKIQSQSTAYMALSNSIDALTSGAIEEGFRLLSKKLSNEFGQDIRVCPMLESSVFRNDVSKENLSIVSEPMSAPTNKIKSYTIDGSEMDSIVIATFTNPTGNINGKTKDVDIPPRVSDEQVKRDETAELGEMSNVEKDPQMKEDIDRKPRPDGETLKSEETAEQSDASYGEKHHKDNEDINRESLFGEGTIEIDNETCDSPRDKQDMKDFTEIRLEKKSQLDNMLERLELQSWFPSKIHLEDITAIDLLDLKGKESQGCLPWRFLKQIVMAKTTARDHNVNEYFYPENVINDNEDDLCPIDMFITIFYCCDPMLKQFVCSKLFMCRQAMPFMIDDPINLNTTILSLWPLRPIVVEWKNSKQVSIESFILEQPTKICSFLRIGRPSFSKSKLQNDMLSVNKLDTFYNKDSPLGESERSLCRGYVEASWYLPGGIKNDMYDEFIMFLNVRGDLSNDFNKTQNKFIAILSAVMVLFIDIQTLTNKTQHIMQFLNSGGNHILVICLISSDKTYENKVFKLTEEYKQSTNKELSVVYTRKKGKERNAAEMEMIIKGEIKKQFKVVEPVQFDKLLKRASAIGIQSDEETEDCKEGKRFAETLLTKIKNSGKQVKWKENITPLQHEYWVELSKMKKQLQRSFNEFGDADRIKQKIKKIKECQSKNISEPVIYFINTIVLKNDNRDTILYFIEWLKIFLDDISRQLLPNLRKTYNEQWQRLNDMKQSDASDKDILIQMQNVQSSDKLIADASFGVEHLFREVGQLFESATSSQGSTRFFCLPPLHKMSKAVAKLMLYGYPFELLDGDASNIPIDWVKSVLNAFQKLIGSKKKFLTLSVLGIQSSGKSTLLNTMFGLKFAVSAGRCTRGVYIQIVKVVESENVPFDYVMVIDSEGLRAPELKDKKKDRDNELATFVIGLGDITLMNIKGENHAEINDVLEITIHAFLRLKAVNNKLDLRQKCIFVHQNVPAINAQEKMKYGIQMLVEKLDSMTKEAAQSEHLDNITTFNQVIEFDGSKHVWYVPDLWQGDPPMAAINKGYSEKIEDLRSNMMKMAVQEKHKSYKRLPDIIVHADELWKGILSEDFVFSFRNSLEIKAYLQMESKYKEITWKLECFVRNGIQSDVKNGLNNCTTADEVDKISSKLFSTLKDNFQQQADITNKEMEHFFEHSDYEEIVINWKVNRLHNLIELTEYLVKSMRKDIDYHAKERKVQIMTSSTNEKHIEQLHDASIELARELQGQCVSPVEINKKFEKIWQTFVENLEDGTESEIESSRQMFVDTLKDDILYTERNLLKTELTKFNNLEKQYGLSKLTGSFKKIGFTEETVDIKKNIVKRFAEHVGFTKSSLDVVEKQANLLFYNIDETIGQFTSKGGELKQSEVKQILVCIQHWFERIARESKELGFTVRSSFKVRLYVFISCHASGIFYNHNVRYREQYGFNAKMTKYKAQVRTIFDGYLDNRKAEATASTILGDEIEDFVHKLVNERLPLKAEETLISSIPCIKYYLILEILKDLADRDKFEYFLQYIHTPEQCAESWVTKTCKNILFDEKNVYKTLATTEITKLLNEIKHAIANASRQCGSNKTIKDWIKMFATDLTECKMEIERFNSLKRIKVVDFSNLETILDDTMCSIEERLISKFDACNVTSVTWDTNPYMSLKDRIWGCQHNCVYCGEPCSKGNDHSGTAHSSIQHRPSGLKGQHMVDSREISVTSCNFKVQSTLRHNCATFDYACNENNEACDLEYHDYKLYREYITNWDIEPCADMDETTRYWMWVMASHSDDFKDRYDVIVSNIPGHWHEITKKEAVESIHKLYKASAE